MCMERKKISSKSAIPQSHPWLQFTSIVEFLSLCILWKMISLMLSACCISAEDECAGAIKVGSFIQLWISYSFISHTTAKKSLQMRKNGRKMNEGNLHLQVAVDGWLVSLAACCIVIEVACLLLKMHLRLILNGMLGVISTKIDKNIFATRV